MHWPGTHPSRNDWRPRWCTTSASRRATPPRSPRIVCDRCRPDARADNTTTMRRRRPRDPGSSLLGREADGARHLLERTSANCHTSPRSSWRRGAEAHDAQDPVIGHASSHAIGRVGSALTPETSVRGLPSRGGRSTRNPRQGTPPRQPCARRTGCLDREPLGARALLDRAQHAIPTPQETNPAGAQPGVHSSAIEAPSAGRTPSPCASSDRRFHPEVTAPRATRVLRTRGA